MARSMWGSKDRRMFIIFYLIVEINEQAVFCFLENFYVLCYTYFILSKIIIIYGPKPIYTRSFRKS
jgi:hypothetical protein